MGRGSYYGGSTIIGQYTDWSDNGSKKRPVKKNKKSQPSLKESKINFLSLVIEAELNGLTLPPIPKKSDKILRQLIDEKGGVEKWAKSQPNYEKLKDKKIKRKRLKKAKKLTTQLKPQDLVNISQFENRIAFNRQLIEKAQKQISQDQAEIKKIKQNYS